MRYLWKQTRLYFRACVWRRSKRTTLSSFWLSEDIKLHSISSGPVSSGARVNWHSSFTLWPLAFSINGCSGEVISRPEAKPGQTHKKGINFNTRLVGPANWGLPRSEVENDRIERKGSGVGRSDSLSFEQPTLSLEFPVTRGKNLHGWTDVWKFSCLSCGGFFFTFFF